MPTLSQFQELARHHGARIQATATAHLSNPKDDKLRRVYFLAWWAAHLELADAALESCALAFSRSIRWRLEWADLDREGKNPHDHEKLEAELFRAVKAVQFIRNSWNAAALTDYRHPAPTLPKVEAADRGPTWPVVTIRPATEESPETVQVVALDDGETWSRGATVVTLSRAEFDRLADGAATLPELTPLDSRPAY